MLTARNSVNKSAAFGRNRFSHHTSRKGDSPPVVLLTSCQELTKLPKDEAKSPVELIPTDNDEQSFLPNSVSDETSVHEKRAAKRRRQKEKKVNQNGKLDDQSYDSVSCLKSSEELQLPEYIADDLVELQKKDEINLVFGVQDKSEALGLAFVKNELSLSNANISECSESLELDEYEVENAKLEQFDDSPDGILSDPLDPRSSVTDSSGIETSSDADGEHQTFATNSSASSVKDHDIIDDAYMRCDDHQGGHLASLQWDQTDAGFIVVTKKKKVKSSKSNEEQEDTSLRASNQVSCDKDYFQGAEKDQLLKPSISSCTTDSTVGSSQNTCDVHIKSNSEHLLSQDQSIQSSNRYAADNACSFSDNGSSCTDDASSQMGLSQFDCDDYPSYPSNNDSNWTVVRTVRRSKSVSQNLSNETVIENGKQLTSDATRCSNLTTGNYSAPNNITGKSRMKSEFGGQSENSQYVSNRESFKNVNRFNERNVTRVGNSGVNRHHVVGNASSGRAGNLSNMHQNLSRSSSVNENCVSAENRDRFRIPRKTNFNSESFTISECKGNAETKRILLKTSADTSEKTSFFRKIGETCISSRHHIDAMIQKCGVCCKFDVKAAARYVEEDYQEVMKKLRITGLVVTYDPKEDV